LSWRRLLLLLLLLLLPLLLLLLSLTVASVAHWLVGTGVRPAAGTRHTAEKPPN
jgi:hypothetical protein